MRVCLDIEFENKIVCILGAGRVAYRKAKQFCDAGANVYINSIEYEDDFKNLDVNIVSYQELLNLLSRASLAIACTNDKSVNERFINEAKRYKVLTMSVQKDEGQDSFSVSQLRKDHLLLACNTNGSFPLANKMILDKLDKRMALLSDIRNKLHDHHLCEYLFLLNSRYFHSVFLLIYHCRLFVHNVVLLYEYPFVISFLVDKNKYSHQPYQYKTCQFY